jgi:GTP pyrophosphokinase
MLSFDTLADKIRAFNPDADTALLRQAYDFSVSAHAGQKRQSGEPYVTHPLEVASLVADMRLDDVAIAAGLLHDVVEDTLTTIDRVLELFGPEVAHVVEGVTKISVIPFSSTQERQAENFRKMLLAMVDDIRVILVKLADRIHNMRTLDHLAESRRTKIAQETLDIYAPIAHRLGMKKIKDELEDLAFKHLEPKAYEMVRAWVERRRKATESTVDDLTRTLHQTLTEAGAPFQRIESRIKRLYAVHKKVRRQRVSLEQVYDLIALRVITTSVRDCYATLGIIHQTWQPVPGRFKDLIAMPRANRYQSLHTKVVSHRGVKFEVQIRTEAMHAVAEQGIAAHWKYKEGRIGVNPDEEHFTWLRQLLEVQQDVRDPGEFIQNLKVDLYPDEVYIFTPKGEVKALPRGATPIDFAYGIHTDVGHQCVGARVNGRMVPVRTRLVSGDIVEVVTAPGHTPSRDWLNIVVTSRARNKIKHFIHAEEKVHAVELGRKLVDKELRQYNLVSKSVMGPEAVERVAHDFGVQKVDDLFAAIGYGKVSPRSVLGKLLPTELTEKPGSTREGTPAGRTLGSSEETVKVRGFDDLLVFRARCCNPIRGEDIVGYVTRGKGVSVHAARCPNVLNLLYDPERRIDVVWDKREDETGFSVLLGIQVEDRQGILADVTSKVAGLKTNVRKVEATSNEHHGRISMTMEISDLTHLRRIIKVIRGISGVLEVERLMR